jgi:hypothetical protein
MTIKPFAALAALALASPLAAQTAAPDPTYVTPLNGTWTYTPVTGGSEAVFRDAAARPQLMLQCTRASRQVRISKPASGAAPFMTLWTSAMTRSIPASFDPATGHASVTLTAYDALLDALALSRARLAVTLTGSPQLVLPNWAEVERVIEDCRA